MHKQKRFRLISEVLSAFNNRTEEKFVFRQRLRPIGGLLLVCLSASSFFYAQKKVVVGTTQDLAGMYLNSVHIESQGIEGVFTQFSLTYDIPIGLELAADDDEFKFYSIDFKTGTLATLLDQFVSQNSKYAWEIDEGIVHVFPKSQYRDPFIKKLLETKIGVFSVKEQTSCWVFENSLLGTPEVKAILDTSGITRKGLNFSGDFIPQLGRALAFDVSNAPMKSILNKVINESPVAKIWVARRILGERRFILRLNARIEDVPLENRPVFPNSIFDLNNPYNILTY